MFYRTTGDWSWVLRSGTAEGGGEAPPAPVVENSEGEALAIGAGEGPGVSSPSESDAGKGDGSEASGGAAAPSPPPSPPSAGKVDWRDRRIAQLTARLREAQQQSPKAPDAGAEPVDSAGGFSAADVERLAEEKANAKAALVTFNAQCDTAAAEGRRVFGPEVFNSRVASLQRLVDGNDQSSVQQYNSLLAAALETGEASKVLHELGSDLDEAARILALSPTKMAVELTKRALAVAEPSRTPRPPTPVGGRGASHEKISPDDTERADHLSTSDWMKRRDAQIAERRAAR